MPASPLHPAQDVAATRWLAVGSLLGLIVLCLAWELWLAPLRYSVCRTASTCGSFAA